MTITYYSGPSGTLTGGSSYAFQFTGYDKDTWNQGGSNYLAGNWAHSASVDFSIGDSILSTGSISFDSASSSLNDGTMR